LRTDAASSSCATRSLVLATFARSDAREQAPLAAQRGAIDAVLQPGGVEQVAELDAHREHRVGGRLARPPAAQQVGARHPVQQDALALRGRRRRQALRGILGERAELAGDRIHQGGGCAARAAWL
jgi:hypothetical protein